MANFQVYPTNLANPGRIGTIRMTLNIIFVLIILTHAQGFESIKKYGGQGPLAVPYSASLARDVSRCCVTYMAYKQMGTRVQIYYRSVAIKKCNISSSD